MDRSEIIACIQEGRLLLYGQPKWTIGKNTCNTYEVFVEKYLCKDGSVASAQEMLATIEADPELTDLFSMWFTRAAMLSAAVSSSGFFFAAIIPFSDA